MTRSDPKPQPLGDTTAHYWLVQRMAKAVGVDLVRARTLGLLPQDDWAGMVHRCRGCDWADGCPHWMDQACGTAPAPSRCVNRDRFEDLKTKLQEAME